LLKENVKRERGEKELKKREVDEKKSRFEILFGIREKEEKYKRKKCVHFLKRLKISLY